MPKKPVKRAKKKTIKAWVYKLPDIDELPPFQFRPSALFFPVFPTKKKALGYKKWLDTNSLLNLPGKIVPVTITLD